MENKNKNIPEMGFLTLKSIIGNKRDGVPPIIPVGRTTWYAGVKSGLFPQPFRLGPRLNVWAVEDILALVEKLKNE